MDYMLVEREVVDLKLTAEVLLNIVVCRQIRS
jgi:hypothetical protein